MIVNVSSSGHGVPWSVKCALGLLILYAIGAPLALLVFKNAAGFEGPPSPFGILARVLVIGAISLGLLRRAKWAWWISVVLGGIGVVIASFILIAFVTMDPRMKPANPLIFRPIVIMPTLCLVVAAALLVNPSSRLAFGFRSVPKVSRVAVRKSPGLATLLNAFPLVLGLGYLYLALWYRFLFAFGLQIALGVLMSRGASQLGFALTFLWVFTMIDAHRQARATLRKPGLIGPEHEDDGNSASHTAV
jgi:hypothetical protein